MSSGPQFLDLFAGFGGSSSGLVEAGFSLNTAFNHWATAISVHSANHRAADHVQGDLSGYDMRRLPKGVPVLWASPECTWHSPAGGRKRLRRAELDLFDDYVPTDAGERSRATMFDPIRAAEARGFDVVVIENVPEVASWPLFNSWLKMWEALDYAWQIVNVSAAHVYSESNAPAGQWRDRIYIVFARKGVKMPRIAPAPPAWCPQCEQVVETRQHWKKPAPPGTPQVGKYRQQYVYVCAANRHATQIVEPYVLPAAAVIDWSDLGPRLGDRTKPLAANTMRRIEIGLRMFAEPITVAHSGQTWDAANPAHPHFGDPESYWRTWPLGSEPLMTRQAGGTGDAIAVQPFYTAVNHDTDDRARLMADGPLPTRSTKIGDGLVFPPIIPELYGTGMAKDIDQPIGTLTTSRHHALAMPPEAFLTRQYSHQGTGKHLNTSVHSPMHAVTGSGGNHSLVVPGRRPKQLFDGDLPFELEDVRFRMLGPVEHLRAQRFWEGYDTSAANKSETTKGAGNAVAVNVAHWIGEHLLRAVA